jgi:hypothetical protein
VKLLSFQHDPTLIISLIVGLGLHELTVGSAINTDQQHRYEYEHYQLSTPDTSIEILAE